MSPHPAPTTAERLRALGWDVPRLLAHLHAAMQAQPTPDHAYAARCQQAAPILFNRLHAHVQAHAPGPGYHPATPGEYHP